MKNLICLILTLTVFPTAFAAETLLNGKYLASDVIDDLPGSAPGCYNEKNYGSESYYKAAGELFPAELRVYGSNTRPLLEMTFKDIKNNCEISVTSGSVNVKSSDSSSNGLTYTKYSISVNDINWYITNQSTCLSRVSSEQRRQYTAKISSILGKAGPNNFIKIDAQKVKGYEGITLSNLITNKFNSAAFCKNVGAGYKYTGSFGKVL